MYIVRIADLVGPVGDENLGLGADGGRPAPQELRVEGGERRDEAGVTAGGRVLGGCNQTDRGLSAGLTKWACHFFSFTWHGNPDLKKLNGPQIQGDPSP